MKRIKSHIIITLLVAALTLIQNSCIEEGPKTYENSVVSLTPMSLNLSKKSVTFNTYESSTQTIEVTSTGVSWEFRDIPSWISITPSTGTGDATVKIACTRNAALTDRMGVVTFRSRSSDWNYSTTFTVTQIRSIYTAIPDREAISFEWTESQAVVMIDANSDKWDVSVDQETSPWCTVKKLENSIEINCKENTSTTTRTGTVTVYTDQESHDIRIVQGHIQFDLSTDSTALYFSDMAGTAQLDVNTYPGVTWTVTTSDEWIRVVPTSGKGNGTIDVSVDESDQEDTRTGYVYVSTTTSTSSMPVIQNGKYLNVISPELEFGSTGGKMQVSVNTNGAWRAWTESDWIILSDTTGKDDCVMELKVKDNNSGYDRAGDVIIAPKYKGTSVKLSVVQRARYLTLSDVMTVFWAGDTLKTIYADADGPLDARTECGWMSVSVDSNKVNINLLDTSGKESLCDTVTVFVKDLDGGTIEGKIAVHLRGIDDSYVDLGLSVKWAVCNVGAIHMGESGDFYAWGETETYYEPGYAQANLEISHYDKTTGKYVYDHWNEGKEAGYDWKSYKFCTGTEYGLTKYIHTDYSDSYGSYTADGLLVLEPEDDVAHVRLGGDWRMPTIDEFKELLDNCTFTWTSHDGMNGFDVTSNVQGYEGNMIFLPAAGRRHNKSYYSLNSYASYWSSSLSPFDYGASSTYAEIVDFSETNPPKYAGHGIRIIGNLVRPVLPYNENELYKLHLDNTELNILIGGIAELKVTGIKAVGSSSKVCVNPVWTSSDTTVAVVDKGIITAKGLGTCTVTAAKGSLSVSCTINVLDPADIPHKMVDMGLSVKWATMNVGAINPEEYGDYYAWGETEPYYEAGYALENPCNHWKEGKTEGYVSSSYFDTKYVGAYGTVFYKYDYEAKIMLDPEDDVAHVDWGDGWRIPSVEEIKELIDSCTWTWTTIGDINGYRITSNRSGYADRSIFLPAAGYRYDRYIDFLNDGGRYWANSIRESYYYDNYSNTLSFNYGGYSANEKERYHGLPVRPVRSFDASDLKEIKLETGSIQIMLTEQSEIVPSFLKLNGETVPVDTNLVTWTSSDTTIAKLTGGLVTPVSEGSCQITVSVGNLSAVCSVTVLNPDDAQKEAVDLGLSVKWATFNVGAISPERYGDYYAWGETDTYYEYGKTPLETLKWKDGKSGGYVWSSYFDTDNGGGSFHKYFGEDDKQVLDQNDDVAHVKWGDPWRMPTDSEMQELVDNCNWTKITYNGVEGYKVSGKKVGYENNFIFLPIAGRGYSTDIEYKGSYGYYWSGSYYTYYYSQGYACGLELNNRSTSKFYRYYGFTIRPVCSYDDMDVMSIWLNTSSFNCVLGQKEKVEIKGRKNDLSVVQINPVLAEYVSSDSTVAIVKDGVLITIGPGSCTITVSLGTLSTTCEVSVTDPDQVDKEFVDMGLSVKWATFNVGAIGPESNGDYYAWGETSSYYMDGQGESQSPEWKDGKASGYTYSSYFDTGDGGVTFFKYNGDIMVLEPDDDVAHVKWGGSWRMPTSSELFELYNNSNCTWKWTTQNGVTGYKVTSMKSGYEDKFIFLPTTVYRNGKILNTNYSYYWSSISSANNAMALRLSSDGRYMSYDLGRYIGAFVRPVCEYGPSELKEIELNFFQFKLLPGNQLDLVAKGIRKDNSSVLITKDSVSWESGNEAVATVTDGRVIAVSVGSCTITATYGTHSTTCTINVIDPDDLSPLYIDLGLSVKWATFNVGAYSPEMYGDYYACGETEPYYEVGQAMLLNPDWKTGKTNGYIWSSYTYCNGKEKSLTKYCNSASYGKDGYTDGKLVLDAEDDVAHVMWGGDWRTPDIDELNELKSGCKWTWTALNGIKGFLVTSNKTGYTDRSIFIPAAGVYKNKGLEEVGSGGYYWSRNVVGAGTPSYAKYFYFTSSPAASYNYRYFGYTVRPVSPFIDSDIDRVGLDIAEKSLVPGEPFTLTPTVYKKDGYALVKATVQWTSGDETVATVNGGSVTAIGPGTCTITASFGIHSASCTVTVVDMNAVVPEYVDLGLSVKWATFNVGAYSPEGFGDYYAWGETDTYYNPGHGWIDNSTWKSDKTAGYTWSDYEYCRGSNSTLTKYCSDGGFGNNGYTDDKTILEAQDDIASVKWGGTWRMPTIQEFTELCNDANCTWTWVTQNGVSGWKVTSKVSGHEGNCIFLPVSGYRNSTGLYGMYTYGYYWSSSLSTENTYEAYYLQLSGSGYYVTTDSERYHGYVVRPVCP